MRPEYQLTSQVSEAVVTEARSYLPAEVQLVNEGAPCLICREPHQVTLQVGGVGVTMLVADLRAALDRVTGLVAS